MPGGPGELEVLSGFLTDAFFVPDRFNRGGANVSFDSLAGLVAERYAGEAIRLVAFSLGTRPALEIASRLGGQVIGIDLIAPAAPLHEQDCDMAGYPVFMAARRHPTLFGMLVRLQAAVARTAPALVYAALFGTAQGADLTLSRDPAFRAAMMKVLLRCFEDGGQAYRAEISAYVMPWEELPTRVTQPVTLWHGTLDNWAPIAMSDRFSHQLPNVVAFHRLEGLSHYSTLKAALSDIFTGVKPFDGVCHA